MASAVRSPASVIAGMHCLYRLYCDYTDSLAQLGHFDTVYALRWHSVQIPDYAQRQIAVQHITSYRHTLSGLGRPFVEGERYDSWCDYNMKGVLLNGQLFRT